MITINDILLNFINMMLSNWPIISLVLILDLGFSLIFKAIDIIKRFVP